MSIEPMSDLLRTCDREVDRLLQDFDSSPSRTGFYDIGSMVEILVLTEGIPEADLLLQAFRDAAARWLRSGLLEDLLMARVEFAYHVALLTYLAQRGADYLPNDVAIIRGLCEGRVVGRSEMPVLRQHVITRYFSRCGVHVDFGDIGCRNLASMIDKRVLRPRSDEYDLLTLLMCAQLLQCDPGVTRDVPKLYPQMMLVQSIRSRNINWTPVLFLLCALSFGITDELRKAAMTAILEDLPVSGELLPGPKQSALDSDYVERNIRGLRLRSSLAALLSMHVLGDSNVNETDCLALG